MKIGLQHLGKMEIQVVDPVTDYARLMESLFDFPAIRAKIAGGFDPCFDRVLHIGERFFGNSGRPRGLGGLRDLVQRPHALRRDREQIRHRPSRLQPRVRQMKQPPHRVLHPQPILGLLTLQNVAMASLPPRKPLQLPRPLLQ